MGEQQGNEGRFDSSAYPWDRDLMLSLGLRTEGFRRERTDLGTVVIHEDDIAPTTVKVEVTALPAQFWHFTVTRPVDDLGPHRSETLTVDTGTGSFKDYWPAVLHVANNCFVVTAASGSKEQSHGG